MKSLTQAGSKTSGRVLAISSSLLMSIAPILIKFGLGNAIDPLPLLTLRFLLAAAILWIGFLIFNRSVLKIRRADLWKVLLVSALFATAYHLFYQGLLYIDASIAHMIFAMNPAVVLILLAITTRRVSLSGIVRLLAVIFGVYLLVGPSGDINFLGVVLILGMMTFYGAYIFLVDKLLSDVPAITLTIYIDTFVALMLGGVYLVQFGTWQSMPIGGWVIIIITAILSTALAHLFFIRSIQIAGSEEVSLLTPLETVFTVIWAVIFLSERLEPIQWFGGALILVSAFLINRYIMASQKEVEVVS
ncbi:MAG: DMT family transporter [Chloroflexi bacterium]|nr:MAG: DMT family transporter [Chloroflexota bacterium]MBL1195661.1 DMT family transporter [Chloroflexota bacterium]NOH12949.1 DMT family transporter [Chloroflexota bacterium]